ncbi:predicted protein [Chaetomium globosum CBS 148.51]|uniref:Uncharacterized protein n=1 Tax=Chaetomium globosum (strain ATCC 6205 / CBS 148.51 / DSM 1962 / NBRC 6347 / NRRL 1970) TaxID=306901 RepID=Q2GNK4_CHAGB|nr:uncharacterized protein CHGG_10450 [Chaetomium globosum CBS 148.51]EAQ84046.1 predicted protein [Chaetomium globosum CBS 148.51]
MHWRQAEPAGDRAVDIMQCNPRDGRWSGRRRSMPSDGSRDYFLFTTGTVLILWVSDAPDQERVPGPRGSETRLHGGLDPVQCVESQESRRLISLKVTSSLPTQQGEDAVRPYSAPGNDFDGLVDGARRLFAKTQNGDEGISCRDSTRYQRHGRIPKDAETTTQPSPVPCFSARLDARPRQWLEWATAQDQANKEATPRPMIEMQDPRSARSVDPRWPPATLPCSPPRCR